jgi:hypothetical protein
MRTNGDVLLYMGRSAQSEGCFCSTSSVSPPRSPSVLFPRVPTMLKMWDSYLIFHFIAVIAACATNASVADSIHKLKLSPNAQILVGGTEGYANLTKRWQYWNAPDVDAIVQVATSGDVAETVSCKLRHLSKSPHETISLILTFLRLVSQTLTPSLSLPNPAATGVSPP